MELAPQLLVGDVHNMTVLWRRGLARISAGPEG
jgi:hypothetical protein